MSSNGICTDQARRHDFKLVFDVVDGNPNGDPDAGNLPRVDPETMQGLVTDVAIKRKVRNWVAAARGDVAPWRIYVQNRGIALNDLHQEAYDATGLKSTGSKQQRKDIDAARRWMCEQFYDIRTFGAVMTTGVNCGQVRGPVQVSMARSVDPIAALDISITRVAITDPKADKETEMGRKPYVPYGLYIAAGAVSPLFADATGFGQDDLRTFWDGLIACWDLDRSAARGIMSCRGLYVFSHTSRYGDAPAHSLLDRVRAFRAAGVDAPRRFDHYRVEIDEKDMPEGVHLTRMVG